MKTLEEVTVVCASKYFTVNEMQQLYLKGIRHFGENRVEIFLSKYELLKHLNVQWHFIGHLQTNKASKIVPYLNMLHTLDSLKLADIIQMHRETPLDVMIQVNTTNEPQKNGIELEKLDEFYQQLKKYDKINIVGLMTMGKLEDEVATESAFVLLKAIQLKMHLPFISMGMSDDVQIALKHDTTHVRLGRYFKALLEN
jgi:PLP dependent protein